MTNGTTPCISGGYANMMTNERTETRACDLISRQAVIDTVRTIILGFFSNEDGAMTDTEKTLLSVNKAVCNGVRALPSAQQDCTECAEYDHETKSCPKYCDVIRETVEEVQPERKTGRWIEQDDSWDGVYYECSACGEPWTLIDGTPWDNGMNFCPNCGADMRGEGEK